MRAPHQVALLVVAALLAGCDGGPADSQAPTSPSPTPAAAPETPADDTGNGEHGDDGPGDADESPGSDADTAEPTLQGSVEVDAEQQHPSGVLVRITQLTLDGNALYLDVEIFNGGDRDHQVAHSAFYTQLRVGDRELTYRPPDSEDDMTIPPGGELTGRLAFLGQVRDPDQTVTLGLNHNDEWTALNPDRPRDIYPSFLFEDLPLPTGE